MLEEMLKENKIKLKFTTRVKETYQNATIIFIGVGTPNNINVEGKITDENAPVKSSKGKKQDDEEEFNW